MMLAKMSSKRRSGATVRVCIDGKSDRCTTPTFYGTFPKANVVVDGTVSQTTKSAHFFFICDCPQLLY